MTASALDRERLACWPMGDLEFVVETLRRGRVEKWFVLRPHRELATEYRAKGVALPRGCRLVVEAQTLKPVGVLASDIPPPARPPAGYNPYFDVPPT
jgi:hypothetical protein